MTIFMNAFEKRREARRAKRRAYNVYQKEQAQIQRYYAEMAYEHAFWSFHGYKPTTIPKLSTKKLKAESDRLYSAAHERNLGGLEDD